MPPVYSTEDLGWGGEERGGDHLSMLFFYEGWALCGTPTKDKVKRDHIYQQRLERRERERKEGGREGKREQEREREDRLCSHCNQT